MALVCSSRLFEVLALAPKLEPEDSKTRLIQAAEQLMREEGYAAVTSRRVASKAGLKPQLVHYYFRTMDDLFLALLHLGAEENRQRLSQALLSAQPLKAFWELSTDSQMAVIAAEFVALANHRKTIRAQIARYAEQFREMQIEALARILEEHGIVDDLADPAALVVVMESVARVLVSETALGMSRGHAETIALVKRYLQKLASLAGKPRKAGKSAGARNPARAT
jgi:TetR/AcrR family transcriptional regulator